MDARWLPLSGHGAFARPRLLSYYPPGTLSVGWVVGHAQLLADSGS
jgi:hypothetical protein